MSDYVEKGYNVRESTVINKEGQELDRQYMKRYQCVRCSYLLRSPYQLICGDRMCKVCFPSVPFDCPLCNEHINPTVPLQFFPDKSCENDLKGFVVVCKCGWKGSLDEWEVHEQTCTEMAHERPVASEAQVTLQLVRVEQRKLGADVAELKRTVTKSQKKMDSIEKDVRQVKGWVEELRRQPPPREGEHFVAQATPGASGDVELRPQVKRLNEKYSQLNDIVTQLVSDVEQHKGTLTQMSSSVDHLAEVIPRYESILEELNLKIEILEVKSTTGIYIWKVNELTRRYREARTGKTVSLYSPPFYTSNHGYRLCLRCYLFGDGSGKGSHISLFVVLMKSEYDDLLSWPFKHRVALSLINLENPLNPEAAITHKFVPNPDSSSFHQPKDTFNVASGFPEFAPLRVLNESKYVKNDTIYFRVKLDAPQTPTGLDVTSY